MIDVSYTVDDIIDAYSTYTVQQQFMLYRTQRVLVLYYILPVHITEVI